MSENQLHERTHQYTYQYGNAQYGGFEAKCLEIPGLSAYGDTSAEALEEIWVAVSGWLEVLEEEGMPFPTPIDFSNFGRPEQTSVTQRVDEAPPPLESDSFPDSMPEITWNPQPQEA